MNELNKQPMAGTGLTEVVFPSIRAAMDLNRRNPAAAIEELRRAIPYDLGNDSGGITLYYRGQSHDFWRLLRHFCALNTRMISDRQQVQMPGKHDAASPTFTRTISGAYSGISAR